jgi:hypothetical protein
MAHSGDPESKTPDSVFTNHLNPKDQITTTTSSPHEFSF